MSRSRKDGRRGGAHVDKQMTEVWSRRCKKVNMWTTDDSDYKRITHRHERRVGRRAIAEAMREVQVAE